MQSLFSEWRKRERESGGMARGEEEKPGVVRIFTVQSFGNKKSHRSADCDAARVDMLAHPSRKSRVVSNVNGHVHVTKVSFTAHE